VILTEVLFPSQRTPSINCGLKLLLWRSKRFLQTITDKSRKTVTGWVRGQVLSGMYRT